MSGFPELLTLHGRHSESDGSSCAQLRACQRRGLRDRRGRGMGWVGGVGDTDTDTVGGERWNQHLRVFIWISTCQEEAEGAGEGVSEGSQQKAASLRDVALQLGSPWQLMLDKQLQP